jgi:hypothetical protein
MPPSYIVYYTVIDPCEVHDPLVGEYQRSSAFVPASGDILLCDNRLAAGWYRINSTVGEDIVTDPVEPLHCGTMEPIWMNGQLRIYCMITV